MSRLIDADKLLGVIAEQERWNVSDFVYESIKNAPTIDAVEVVRCKDCKHYDGSYSYPICCRWEDTIKPDDYCSYGEKMEAKDEDAD